MNMKDARSDHGRDDWTSPHPLFDASFYISKNAALGEVAIGQSDFDPLVHYLQHGGPAGFSPHPLFDSSFYLQQCPDAIKDGSNPLEHYLSKGAIEGLDPHPLFDTSYYLDRYPDVAAARMNPLLHFVLAGATERRDPHWLFQTGFYLDGCGGRLEPPANPLVHFIIYGAHENRTPSLCFNTLFYRQKYALPPEENPLIHYVLRGIHSGNEISPVTDCAPSFAPPPKPARSVKPPRIAMTLVVRDERDILESNIRYHHAMGVDEFVVTDNGSIDGTLELLESLAKTIPIYLRSDSSNFDQIKWVTAMARFASQELGAEWIINNDADEFYFCRDRSFKEILGALPSAVTMLEVGRRNFIAIEPPLDAGHPPFWMRFRNRLACDHAGAPLPPKVIHRADKTVCISRGNHLAFGALLQSMHRDQNIEIFHYPIRTFAQFEIKARNAEYGDSCAPEKSRSVYETISARSGVDAASCERGENSKEPMVPHKRIWLYMQQDGRLQGEFARLKYGRQKLEEALANGEVVLDDALVHRLMALGIV